jgi:RNA polymerase sigma-70 factor (ECF subfamily)
MRTETTTTRAGPERSDGEVVADVRAGTREAFREIMERHQDRVYALLVGILRNPETARDLAQETFLKAYVNLAQYDEAYKFGNWLLKIAQNLAFSHLRHVGVDRERLVLDGEDRPGLEALPDPAPMADPAGLVEERVLGETVNRAMESMSEKYRAVLTLRHTQGMAYQEIADVLGVPLGTVKFRLHQAYRLLGEKLSHWKAGR